VHDLSPDGLCYGRIVRPPSRGATLTDLDTTATLALPGVLTVVRDGSFLGVVAEEEEAALGAADRLRADATWERHPTLPDSGGLPGFLRSAAAETTVLAERRARPAREEVAASVEATYDRPYLAHASMGPSSATALFGGGEGRRLQVWSHTQGIYLLRAELARALGLADDDVTVTHVEGPGCYGHNGADDAAMDAALLAMAVPGRPVQVVWSRADELTWAPFGAAAMVRVAADVDAAGNVLSWQHEIWGNGHSTRPGSTRSVALLANSHRAAARRSKPPRNRRWRAAAAPAAIPCLTTTFLTTGRSTTGCSTCRCARPRCARSARSSTCSRPSRSWTSSLSPLAGTRSNTGSPA
jgi:hypothetical protein